jgi:nitric oxide reductase subunit B
VKSEVGRIWQWMFSRLMKKRRDKEIPEKIPSYPTEKAGYPFCLFAILLFGLQGFIATAGSLDVVFPDLPSPISFNNGRAIHLNLSILWPLLGVMGGIYYFFPREAGKNLYSYRAAWWHFGLTAIIVLGILVTLAFGINDGREYLEAWRPLRVGLTVSLALFFYILLRTYLQPGVPKLRPTLISILVGIGTLILLYLPNLFFYGHQTVDELVSFWVIHLWEEMSLELVGTGVVVALLLSITKLQRGVLEGILYLELSLSALTGFLSTGHHYYWIGVPGYWLLLGLAFSAAQLLPIFLLAWSAVKAFFTYGLKDLRGNGRIAVAFLGASVFYHLTGAGLMGLAMSIPSINRWLHGTYLTSAHSHLALAGVFGTLALAISIYVVTQGQVMEPKEKTGIWVAFILVNLGLLIMGGALMVAGMLQVYLGRVLGLEFSAVVGLIRPYLMVRVLGGIVYALGSTLLTWIVVRIAWRRVAV